ncbi:sigma-70 family RNA polymerase sigma factor [Dyadobacter arcticus]|uniref:RNA polymerase sigma-70 factor (ECF subfamily) n=1 Tax=Dyadobacter arcticus TaxID=1078754 RepID=A0ABX0UW75_9BACT|nr:sigma-70 family RNA polymerase sigma factor [Dyadobacter arcticus]NIJ56139.1 RNA polymerase sigma-70 factor (ECF subfamily) [Dyadobacter arcticus]
MYSRKARGLSSTHPLDPHKWVARYADYLHNFALKRIKNQDLARDLVQETLLAALERMDKFEARCSEITWLTAILKHKISDIHRKKLSARLEMLDISELNPFFNEHDGHWIVKHRPVEFEIVTDEAEDATELMEILQKCMKKLPNLWFSVFTMKHMDEKPTVTICDELSITPANFWVIIHRAKLNLRACLQKNLN